MFISLYLLLSIALIVTCDIIEFKPNFIGSYEDPNSWVQNKVPTLDDSPEIVQINSTCLIVNQNITTSTITLENTNNLKLENLIKILNSTVQTSTIKLKTNGTRVLVDSSSITGKLKMVEGAITNSILINSYLELLELEINTQFSVTSNSTIDTVTMSDGNSYLNCSQMTGAIKNLDIENQSSLDFIYTNILIGESTISDALINFIDSDIVFGETDSLASNYNLQQSNVSFEIFTNRRSTLINSTQSQLRFKDYFDSEDIHIVSRSSNYIFDNCFVNTERGNSDFVNSNWEFINSNVYLTKPWIDFHNSSLVSKGGSLKLNAPYFGSVLNFVTFDIDSTVFTIQNTDSKMNLTNSNLNLHIKDGSSIKTTSFNLDSTVLSISGGSFTFQNTPFYGSNSTVSLASQTTFIQSPLTLEGFSTLSIGGNVQIDSLSLDNSTQLQFVISNDMNESNYSSITLVKDGSSILSNITVLVTYNANVSRASDIMTKNTTIPLIKFNGLSTLSNETSIRVFSFDAMTNSVIESCVNHFHNESGLFINIRNCFVPTITNPPTIISSASQTTIPFTLTLIIALLCFIYQ
ncbi:hypothetical protein PPL_03002 [Heterostelium album PN500]|uniref:Uncharacterized protein n=1 Tax=Heterostelium pallidum (strain ATCC 26659 / Pp 5 / PN500) TaxID=670386 RepID=D3B3N4_HETP5|nr:hypothetical protein PPL_03002 [Heterostelium album PN500]EFA83932.1 hypothetical protein PPL_03002 [Heterostelium album PN500]|eukprot:XP_020436049.1 hypothetical protein PPL_03002 [Heterostelium album PN500]